MQVIGFQVGGTVELMVPILGLGGEPSILYGHQQYDEEVGDSDYDLSNYDYLRVPLSLKKKFSLIGLLSMFIQAGPYVEFKINGGDFKDIDDQYKSKSFGTGVRDKKVYQKDRPLIQYDRLEPTIYTLLFSGIVSQFLF